MTAAGAARPGWARTAATSLVVGLATSGSIFAGMVALAPAASAADDSSAVTVTAAEQDPDYENAPFPDLSVTVSQTENLMSQGIRLTYSGGSRSTEPSADVAGANFLQFFQCWGDLKDAAGNLIAATHDIGAISTFQVASGARGTFGAQTFNGQRFNSPNDLVLRGDGNLYFTDPSFQAPGNPQGATRVYRIDPAGVASIVDSLGNPNGITLSPDGNMLYVTSDQGLRRYELAADGTPGAGTTVPLQEGLQQADGMAMDCAGNIYTTEHGARRIRVFDPDGNQLASFGGQGTFANNVTNATVEWAKANGVEFHPFRFHDLRHWHAIEFLKAGWGTIYDLKQRLGHASLTTTEIYLSGGFLTEDEIVASKYGRAFEAREAV